jgi:NAD-reducing hydrogenase large subunit
MVMAQRIVIDPVTRIEGHAKITVYLDDSGQVTNARFHVTEFRGFEKFCEGRPLWEMPGITSRICGICPVSHLLASAKAGDAILAVTIPPTAALLRRMMNLGQIIQSHALSFFHLSAPDFVFGMEGDAAKRNLFGLIAADPQLARNGIRLRQFGQEVIEILGGQKIHPAWAVPGGVRAPLSAAGRARIREWLPEARAIAIDALSRFKQMLTTHAEEVHAFGDFPGLFMGLVTPSGEWEYYDGLLRWVDQTGAIVADQIDPAHYADHISEAVEDWTYLKFPYYRPLGYPQGSYRVGPLARLNVCTRIGVPLADQELREYRDRFGATVTSSFLFHYARLIEILAATELIERLIDDPEIESQHLRASAGINRLEGVGCSEAPRGTLFHHYHVDHDGLTKKVNLLIATGQNNLAMNRTVADVAKHYLKGPHIPEGMLNRLEASIRSFDPCLSCSTHAAGSMPMQVTLVGPAGEVLDEAQR